MNFGSSPRVRGTRYPVFERRHVARFIPACAGNTAAHTTRRKLRTVHPRVCGEHASQVFAALPSLGSSPRVRGTLEAVVVNSCPGRFIPACAGNTQTYSKRQARTPVHPRVCGEHAPMVTEAQGVFGSSPRVRGTRPYSAAGRAGDRFIPACAGNTRAPPNWRSVTPVHPRVCGEHVRRVSSVFFDPGSSPRVRGTQIDQRVRHLRRRFIPACAGNTTSS